MTPFCKCSLIEGVWWELRQSWMHLVLHLLVPTQQFPCFQLKDCSHWELRVPYLLFQATKFKRYRRTAMCSTTVHQGVKDISHSYQKVGRMNEESKGLPEVRMGLTPSNTKPSNNDWASPAQAEFFKKLFLLSIGVVHLTSATLISLKFEPIWPWVWYMQLLLC